jgi:hypothetical protein
MIPPIFSICAASPAVTTLIGSNPIRLFPFGLAPQDVVKPYVTWQTIAGSPENYLGSLPDADSWSVQVDVWSLDAATVLQIAQALRDAFEPVAYITGWGNQSREPETKLYRYNFTVDFIVNR